MELIGRGLECEYLDEFVDAVRGGASRALLIRGDSGVGKTALLDHIARRAANLRVARVAGVECEMRLPYAALHQLCAPMLDSVEHLLAPQRDALLTALGVCAGPPPGRFLVGLAVLNLLSNLSIDGPFICLVDDEQWLDRESAQMLAFVARRAVAESLGFVFAARMRSVELAALPELVLGGLRDVDARTLLESALTGPIDSVVRDRIVAETGGNPLALRELPHCLSPTQLAGGFGLPACLLPSGDMEENFRRRICALTDNARRLLLLAAAEPTGDSGLLWRAADLVGIPHSTAAPVAETGLIEFGRRIQFSHPLVRSAAYRSGSMQERHEVHRALADVTDVALDPDRRAWHHANAASGPDEEVAGELERSAHRAQSRGGRAAAAAFLERAVVLSLDPARRAHRAVVAACAQTDSGGFDTALDLLQIAESGPLRTSDRARVDLTRAQIAFRARRGVDASALLLHAARQFEELDVEVARTAYLDAMSAAILAGPMSSGGRPLDVAAALIAAPRPRVPDSSSDLLLDGFATNYVTGYREGLPILRRALQFVDHDNVPADRQLNTLWIAGHAAIHVWDAERWDDISARHLTLARQLGALGELPLALTSRAFVLLYAGDLLAAESLIAEIATVADAVGVPQTPYAALCLAALRGQSTEGAALIAATEKDATHRGEGLGVALAHYADAMLNNGLARYRQAAVAARRICQDPHDLAVSSWGAVELIEAAARNGSSIAVGGTLERLIEVTSAAGTDWALGIQARSRALLADGAAAERLYREAIDRFDGTTLRVEQARARLVYGEWLRRERRHVDAREPLRTAHEVLDAMGVRGFAGRARRELYAAGEKTHNRSGAALSAQLTAQEAQIARLARDGLSNPEIGSRLFISGRTVQYHLRKVFAKLGISSRSQLNSFLPAGCTPSESGLRHRNAR